MADGSTTPSAPGGRSDELSRPARLAALRRAALLDTPPDAAFDRLTRLASSLLGTPVSLVSIVDTDRQFFKSAVGLPEPWAGRRETALSHSFCQHVVARRAPLVVEDARLDPLVCDNAAVEEIGVVAYAGFPIESEDGEIVGSLCAIDNKPRTWTSTELDVLRELAALAHTELQLRAALLDAERASVERAAVIESSSDGIYTVDLDGACTLANLAASAILGFSVEEMLGRNMHDLVHHHHADGREFPEEQCPLYDAFRGGRSTRVEDMVLWRRDGSAFPAECTSSPLTIDGRIAGAVVAFRDVSERAAAAAALRESEMKFRTVFEDAGIGIVITGLDGRLLEANEAYERLTGYSREELLATTFHAVTHPDDAIVQRRLADDMLRGDIAQVRMDKRYLRKDGVLVWGRLTATLMRDVDGRPTFIVGAVEDVTAQRRSTDAMRLLADAGALLSSSLMYEDTLPGVARLALPRLGDACLVDVLRRDGSVESICSHENPALDASLCQFRRDHPYVPTAASSSSADDERTAGTVARIVALDAPTSGALESEPSHALRALGLGCLISVPLRGRTGTLGQLTFGAARTYDEHDVRLAEELAGRAASAIENAQLYREAQSSTRARDEVLAVVSHDLRNPVHTITMSTSFLLDLPQLEERVARAQLAVIRRSAGRADRLIRDLLDVTRIENGQLRLDRQPVGVRDMLLEAAQMMAAQAKERRITLSVAATGEALTVFADRDRVLQALDNLLGNAVKFTPPEGRIDLDARQDGGGVHFEVRDTGAGVAPSEQPNLFRPFWQARRVDRRGVGLGLSIVKGIVDAHGGSIVVDSDGRSGTRIGFTIPERADAQRAPSGTLRDGG